MSAEKIIAALFKEFSDIRYAAIYLDGQLVFKQRENTSDSSSGETDRFEELLVNPTLLTLATQRGNIDCGGLHSILIAYGNFYQLIKSTPNGHISICLDKGSDLNVLPKEIFSFLTNNHPQLGI